jgi:hypothetical protein
MECMREEGSLVTIRSLRICRSPHIGHPDLAKSRSKGTGLFHPAIDNHVLANTAGGEIQVEESIDYASVGREMARGLGGEEGSTPGLGQGTRSWSAR